VTIRPVLCSKIAAGCAAIFFLVGFHYYFVVNYRSESQREHTNTSGVYLSMAFRQYVTLSVLVLLFATCVVATEPVIGRQSITVSQRNDQQGAKVKKLPLEGVLQQAHIAFDLSSRPWNPKGAGNLKVQQHTASRMKRVKEDNLGNDYLVPLIPSTSTWKGQRRTAETSATLQGGLITGMQGFCAYCFTEYCESGRLLHKYLRRWKGCLCFDRYWKLYACCCCIRNRRKKRRHSIF